MIVFLATFPHCGVHTSTVTWFHEKKFEMGAQCGKEGNLLKRFFGKNFVKATFFTYKITFIFDLTEHVIVESNFFIITHNSEGKHSVTRTSLSPKKYFVKSTLL